MSFQDNNEKEYQILILKKIRKLVTHNESVFVMELLPYISKENNIIMKNNKSISIDELGELMPYEINKFKRIISKLVKKGIFATFQIGIINGTKKASKYLVANPYIFSKDSINQEDEDSLFGNNRRTKS